MYINRSMIFCVLAMSLNNGVVHALEKSNKQKPFNIPTGWQYAQGLIGLSNVALAPEIDGMKTRTTMMTEYLPTPKLLDLTFDESALNKNKESLYKPLVEGAEESGFTNVKSEGLRFAKLPKDKGVFVALSITYTGLEKEAMREETRYIKCFDGRIYLAKILSQITNQTAENVKEAQASLDQFQCKPEPHNEKIPPHMRR